MFENKKKLHFIYMSEETAKKMLLFKVKDLCGMKFKSDSIYKQTTKSCTGLVVEFSPRHYPRGVDMWSKAWILRIVTTLLTSPF